MQRSLLDWLVELIQANFSDEWRQLCDRAHATEPSVSPEEAARRRLRGYSRRYDLMASPETNALCQKFIEHFVDTFRPRMIGRTKGTLETRTIPPHLIRPEELRFDPDELVLKKEGVIVEDVRIEPAPLPSPSAAPVHKLSGKAWVHVAFERSGELATMLNITDAARALARESETAPDLAKRPLSVGYCRDELRKRKVWPLKPRKSPKQHPK